MYETEEIFSENGLNLKEILKSCIYNYYLKNKDDKINDLQKEKNHRIMNATNKEILSEEKGVNKCTIGTKVTI